MKLAHDERFLIVDFRGRILLIDLLLETVERPVIGLDGSICYSFPENIPDDVKRTVANLIR